MLICIGSLQPWVEKEKINNDSYIQKRLEMGHAGSATPSKRKRASESKGYRRAFQFFVNVSIICLNLFWGPDSFVLQEHRQQNPLYWSLFTFNQAQRELSAAWNAISMEEKQVCIRLIAITVSNTNIGLCGIRNGS